MRYKIMVVDDEPSVCRMLRRHLMYEGYSVVEAYSCDQAVEAYIGERPDLVLLDIRMPGKDGLETLRELKAFDPEASVIMVTAVREEELAKRTMDEGAFEYITKPIDQDYLELAITTKLAMA